MHGQSPSNRSNPKDADRTSLLEERVQALETSLKETGVLELFEEPMMISMRLPNRPHPVACSFLPAPGGRGAITLDLQIGGLSSRALAVAGRTTMAEADIIGTTLTFALPPSFDEFEDGCCPVCASQEEMIENLGHERGGRGESSGRHPGKASHAPDAEELETLAFAFQGILTTFHASQLTPTDLSDRTEGILEIRVDGTVEELLAGGKMNVTSECRPFEPIRMAPFSSARLDRSLRRRPLRGKRSWILHILPMNVSVAPTRDTIQVLFALDARTGDIVHQEAAMDGTADAIGRALEVIIQGAGYRPGSAITTSPRLDDILGDGLQRLGVRYVKGRRLKASDPRIQDLEDFMYETQAHILADMMAGPGDILLDPLP